MGRKASPLAKAAFWFVWNFGLGVAPLLIFTYLYNSISNPELQGIAHEEIRHLLRDLIMVFIAIGISGALALDFVYCKHRYPYHFYFFAGAFPFIILSAASIKYSVLIFDKFQNINMGALFWVQVLVLVMCATFCIFIKQDLIAKEDELFQKIKDE